MQVLVTGGAGFIGSHLVDSLVDAGHDVLLIDNLHTGRQANVNTKAMFYRMDLTDHAALGQVFTRNEIQAVFHLGARVNVRESMQDPVGYAAVNVSASLALMELSRAAGVEQFVFISSGGAVYGEGKQADGSHKAFTEADPINPKDNYAANKLAIEQHLALYREAYDFPSAVLRFANIYGPRQNPEAEAGVVAIFTEAMLKNQEVRIHGDGSQARDFLYVSDAVDSCLSALKHRARGRLQRGFGAAHHGQRNLPEAGVADPLPPGSGPCRASGGGGGPGLPQHVAGPVQLGLVQPRGPAAGPDQRGQARAGGTSEVEHAAGNPSDNLGGGRTAATADPPQTACNRLCASTMRAKPPPCATS